MQNVTQETDISSSCCPICEEESHRHFFRLFRAPDIPSEYAELENGDFVRCVTCSTLFRWPIQTLSEADEHHYGESYYDQINRQAEFERNLHGHAQHQILHYKQLHQLLHDRVTPKSHPKWLDVGSCGVPTVFPDFEFTTVEPDPRVVAYGRKFFHPDRVHQGTIQSYQDEGTLDGVVFQNSLYCIPDPGNAIAKAASLIRDEGMLVVCIGGYFFETHDFANDPYVHRLEDVIRGDVMWVYYSLASLKILCARHGFKYLADEVKYPEYSSHKSHRYIIFEKTKGVVDAPSVEEVRAYNTERLEALFRNFSDTTKETLEAFDRDDVAIVGPTELLANLREAHAFKSHVLFVDPNISIEFSSGPAGRRAHLGLEDLADAVRSGDIRLLVIADYRTWLGTLNQIAASVQLNGLRLFSTNRASGTNRLFDLVEGEKRPVKGFAVNEFRLVGAGTNQVSIEEISQFVRVL